VSGTGSAARGDAGVIAVPAKRERNPLQAIARRVLAALGLLVGVTLVVWLGRDGYNDNADAVPLGSVTLLDAAYYATVSLSTTGYGDIVPASDAARLVNILVVTPARLLFLIILVGTTLEVLTERSREAFRISRWRKRVQQHIVLVGYGTKGRSAMWALREGGVASDDIVVVDTSQEAVDSARRDGLVTVRGSAATTDVLRQARVEEAKAVLVTVDNDAASVLITLTARSLAPRASILSAVREDENAPLLRQSGADTVLTSSAQAGRLLGLSAESPRLVGVVEDLLTPGSGLRMYERPVTPDEVGRAPSTCPGLVLSVARAGQVLRYNDPALGALRAGDVVVLVDNVDQLATPAE
jgi:voltage-gated potassium channel